MKKIIFILTLMIVLLSLGVFASMQNYEVQALGVDYNTGELIDDSISVTLGGITRTANPIAIFNNVPSETVFDVSYRTPDYYDSDFTIFFESDLDTLSGQDSLTFITNKNNQEFVTSCELNPEIEFDYICTISNSGVTEKYHYEYTTKKITLINAMVAEDVPTTAPVINEFVVNIGQGDVPLQVEFTWDITDDDEVSRVILYYGDGNSQFVSESGEMIHTYTNQGDYKAIIIATDDQGLVSSSDVMIKVAGEVMRSVEYEVQALAVDYNTDLLIENSVSITLGGKTRTANPIAIFDDVPAGIVYDVSYRHPDYYNSDFTIFFEPDLDTLSGDQSETFLTTNNIGQEFVTECELNDDIENDYVCEVSNNGVTERYHYEHTTKKITLINAMVAEDVSTTAPVINEFDVSRTSGPAPLNVEFLIEVTDDEEVSNVILYFGDGDSKLVDAFDEINHVYTEPGNYEAVVVATDNQGLVSSRDITINVYSGGDNLRPVAIAGDDIITELGDEVTLDGTDSYDLDSDIQVYQWEQVSGEDVGLIESNIEGSIISFTPEEIGTYVFKLCVSDGELIDCDYVTVKVVLEGESKSKTEIFVNRIRTNENKVYYKAGDKIDVRLTFSNYADDDIDKVTVQVMIPKLRLIRRFGPFELEDDELMNKEFVFNIPENAKPGTYEMRTVITTANSQRINVRKIKIT